MWTTILPILTATLAICGTLLGVVLTFRYNLRKERLVAAERDVRDKLLGAYTQALTMGYRMMAEPALRQLAGNEELNRDIATLALLAPRDVRRAHLEFAYTCNKWGDGKASMTDAEEKLILCIHAMRLDARGRFERAGIEIHTPVGVSLDAPARLRALMEEKRELRLEAGDTSKDADAAAAK
jgi:hypothetical protein